MNWKRWLTKPWVLILLFFVLAGIAFVFSFNSIMKSLLHNRPEVVVPILEGKNLTEALAILTPLNLSIKQEGTEYDESLPAGTILRQQPRAGMQIRSERAINVVVSKGGQSVFVPLIVGRRLAEAQSAMAAEGLQMGAVNEVFSTTFDEKVVVAQYPSSGTIVARGALVDVDVSKGLPPAGAPIVPNFIQQNVENAREWALAVNTKIDVREEASAVGVAGTVVKQSPSAGQPLLVGENLVLTIVPLVASEKASRLSYSMPAGNAEALLRILARDNRGENEIYSGVHKPSEVVEIPIQVSATTRVRIYVDGLLQEERVIEP